MKSITNAIILVSQFQTPSYYAVLYHFNSKWNRYTHNPLKWLHDALKLHRHETRRNICTSWYGFSSSIVISHILMVSCQDYRMKTFAFWNMKLRKLGWRISIPTANTHESSTYKLRFSDWRLCCHFAVCYCCYFCCCWLFVRMFVMI